jgi:hypothetical protein
VRSHPLPLLILAAVAAIPFLAPRSSFAATPQSKPACGAAAVANHKLASRRLTNGNIEYYGRYEMSAPDGNPVCYIRQTEFYLGRLANDYPQGTPNGPTVSIVIQHGLFHCRVKNWKITMVTQLDGPSLMFTVDAQTTKPVYGAYYAKISIIGKPPTEQK